MTVNLKVSRIHFYTVTQRGYFTIASVSLFLNVEKDKFLPGICYASCL